MRATIITAILLLAPFARAMADDFQTLRCNSDTVVLAGHHSPNHRYELGWTIRPVAKDAPAVDWSKLHGENQWVFWAKYVDEFEGSKRTDYTGVVGVVDHSRNTFTDLPDSEGYFGSRRSIDERWLDENTAVVTVDARYPTLRLYLVKAGKTGITAMDLTKSSDEMVRNLLHKIRPLAPEMCVYYGFEESRETKTPDGEVVTDRVPCKIKDGVLHSSFGACIPKFSYEDVEGHLLISLKDGKPLKAISNTSTDQPFVGKLGAADNRLHKIYGKLRKQLGADEFKQLAADQKDWISMRNSEAKQAGDEAARNLQTEDSTIEEEQLLKLYRQVRNQKALELTQQRTAELQKRLDAADTN